MGKVKKAAVVNKDEGQKKISSFFQKPSEKPQAKLFSEFGTNGASTCIPACSRKVSPPCSKAKENKSPPGIVEIINDAADAEEFAPAKKLRSPTDHQKLLEMTKPSKTSHIKPMSGPERKGSPKSKNASNDNVKSKEAEVCFVPETQFIFTPENKPRKKVETDNSLKSASDVFHSPVSGTSETSTDFGIIPDTPDSSKIQVKPKKPLGRSFLLSASSFASNPIQKAKENREAKLALKKKRASLAKKGSVSVCVEFKDQNIATEPYKFMKEARASFRESSCDTTTKISDNEVKIENVAVSHTLEISVDDKTPTKVYGNAETASIKRMAKSGISPAAKRSDGQNFPVNVINSDDTVRVLSFEGKTNQGLTAVETTNFETEENVNDTFQNLDANQIDQDCVVPFGDVIEFEKQRQERQKQKKERLDKRRLELLKERRKREKEIQKRNQEKLLNYQLSGNASLGKRKSCGRSVSDIKETVETDETLEDLLQELKSPSLLKNDSKPKIAYNVPKPFVCADMTKPLRALNADSCDTDPNCDKMTVLKSKLNERSQFESLDSNDSFGNIVAEWTDEDEKFFKKLGMSTETVTNVLPNNLCDRTDNISCIVDNSFNKEMEDECNMKGIKQSSTVVAKSKAVSKLQTEQRTSDSAPYKSAYDAVMVNKDIELDIKDFQTQDIVKLSSDMGSAENDNALFPTPSKQTGEKQVSLEEMEIDEFGSQLDSQLLCDEFEHLTPFKASSKSSDSAADIFQSEAPCSEFGRHIVTAVEHDSVKHETVLTLSAHPSETARKCVLHGFWLDTHIQVGDIVNVLARFKDNTCHITDSEGLLVVNPDILLSGTTVVSSVFCMRKSILKEKFKGCDKGNIQMLYGSIIHSVFQQVLRKKLLAEEAILEESDRIVRQTSNLMEMYGNKVTEDVVMNEIKNYLPQTIAWTKQHTNIGQDIFGNQRKTKPEILVTRVNDIEENIWSPRFGIKGKIDLTVETQLKDEKTRKIVPLELKTGKPSYSVEHKGQVTLYSMMCSDRREDPERGLLLYLKEPSMKVIQAYRVNQKGLIQLRNEMVYYISRQVVKKLDSEKQTTFHLGRLPEPITNLRACQKCPQLINCAIYQREVEGRQSSGDGMSGLVDETLRHLTSSHMTYFTQWCLMLDLESQKDQAKRTVADIWCRSSKDREAVGECISGVVMTSDDDNNNDSNDDSVIVRFHRHRDNKINTPLSSIGINVQDSVVVSCEKPSWVAVCTGFVHEMSSTEIQLLIDREGADRLAHLKMRVLRIDKCDNFSTAGMFYTSVSRLMLDDPQCQKLRHLIIDRIKPEFLNTLSKGNIEKVKSIFKSLNKPQKTSVLKVLMSKDYVLIKGYPGTGKTSTIVALVKVLSMLGHSVLLTSYTHSAVDNILLKLKKDSMKFLRLGRISKIHPGIREFSLEKLTQGVTTTAQLEEFLHSQNIVATSCLGTNHPMFTRRQFDVCIVDEASQVIQPACLGPLFCCQKFVLVGDPKQLPPVVQSKEARDLGMDESLFLRLENTGATFDLNLQYRMNSDIMYLSNQMVYDGCLKCGSQSVADRVLSVPNRNAVTQVLDEDPWLRDVLNDDLSKSVVFLDTEKVPAREEKSQARTLQNPTEARIVLKIVQALVMGGVDPDEIGIIAPYRSQVFLIRSRLSQGEGHWRSKVEVNTVDQYQGRDKSVIIISFVRSSEDQENMTGELLKDVRRLNVALTRAKVKLILIGNISTLKHYPPLKQLIQLLEGKSQILQLPEGLTN